MADNIRKIKIQAVGLKDIKRELDDIKKSMEGATDPSEMAKLTAEADRLESTLGGVNDKVKEFGEESTDSLNGAGKSFEDLKTAITELDFEKVQAGVDSFAKASANMTFKGAIDSLKSLGKTFLTLGKALLTNPLFLLAGVITAIVVAVYKFLDSLGIIEMAIEALMKPIRYIIDLFYSLTDAMGLTNEAAQKAADEKAQAYEDSANRIESANNKVVASLDHEIRMAKLNGEDTVELERRKVKAIEETALARLRADAAAWQAGMINKSLSEEEIKQLEEKARASQAAYFQMRNDVEYFEASVLATERENYNKRLSEAKDFEEKKEAERKQEAADRLAAIRLEEDLELQLMEEGVDKSIRANQLKYKRLIEDTIANEKLTEEEKLRVKQQYADLQIQEEEAITNKITEARKAKEVEAQMELSQLIYGMVTDDQQKVLDSLDEYYEENIDKLRAHLEEGLITREEFNEAEVLLAQEKADKIVEIERRTEEAIRAEKEATLQANVDTATAYASAVNDLAGTIFEMSDNLGKQDEASKEKRAKKQFQVQKALNLVMAGIDGARAITTSLASAPLAIGPIPNPAGIASLAAVAVNTAATMAAIASKQYTGSGGGGGSVPTPKTDVSSSVPTRQAPIANFQGTGGNNNEVGAGTQSFTIENNISVSETEITDKQKTVHNLTAQSQL